uniref:IRG-type G domain-containing protein n=1 Tax=Microcebus murinus TaxID=30608 RepID=A0A8B7WVT4_MICMU|nr:interferon-inducible GTPase 1-like [Microcebus murinus]XP_020139289.1 interferon-inducible GTPase 1-like [Microcebus murinus]
MDQFSSATSHDGEHQDLASSFSAYFNNFRVGSKIISKETTVSIESHLRNGNIVAAHSVIEDALKEIDNATLNIAVTGESGAGKSSFINALRELGPEDEGAAPTGVVETTMERKPYKHPKFPRVTLWDLPGIGSTNFQPKDYLQKVQLVEYDFFIIVSATRFKNNDIQLAKVIKSMKKNFYFVRSKVDCDLRNEQESKPKSFNKEKVLQQMRNNCLRIFNENKIDEAPVFLISNRELSKYDFPILIDTLSKDLPAQKHHIFMLSLPNITDAAIESKRNSLEQHIWLEAFRDALKATVPIISIFSDSEEKKLKEILNNYQVLFGVDDESLQHLAKHLQVPVEQLKAGLKSPGLLKKKKELTGNTLKGVMKKLFSVFGGVIRGVYYFGKIYYLRFNFLDTVANDAKVLLKETYSRKV